MVCRLAFMMHTIAEHHQHYLLVSGFQQCFLTVGVRLCLLYAHFVSPEQNIFCCCCCVKILTLGLI